MVFDILWFKKYQNIILLFCNAPIIKIWFRRILCIDGYRSSLGNRNICEISPYYIKWIEKRTKKKIFFTIEIRTHNKFAKRLYYAFYPLWVVFHFWDWLVANNINFNLNLGFDTLTSYSESTGDGMVELYYQATWAGVRGASSGTASSGSSTGLFCYTGKYNNTYSIGRGFFPFLTGTTLAGATISAATLSIYGGSNATINPGGLAIVLSESSQAAGDSLANGDYDNITLNSPTELASRINFSSWSTSAYNDMALNSSGLSAINKTAGGYTKYSMRTSLDVDNSAPSNENFIYCHFADETGTSNDPKLVVTYTTSYIKTINGLSKSYIKSFNGLAMGSVKTLNGLA